MGWGEDKSNTAPVLIISNNKEITLQSHNKNITFGQFMDRVNWQYGESGGDKSAARYYSHAINNLSNSLRSENTMYLYANNGTNYGIEKNKELLFQGDGSGYKEFRENIRSNNEDLDGVNNLNGEGRIAESARLIVSETISAITGATSDPTVGATNWVADGKVNYALNNRKEGTQVTSVISPRLTGVGKKRHNVNHTFHQLKYKSKPSKHVVIDEAKK